jgi:competence protein ComEC
MALYFEQVSLAALPANLLAAPAIAPVMWLGVLATGAAQIAEPLAAPFTALAAPLLVYIQWVAEITADTPFSVVSVRAAPLAIAGGWALLAAVAGMALRHWSRTNLALDDATPTERARGRRVALAAATLAALVAGVAVVGDGAARAPAPGEVVVSFLDVGQGDATLVQRGATSVLVDTGPPDGPIVGRLREAGIERLDALVLTHAQADHEGAAPAVVREFAPRLVVDGGAGWPNRAFTAAASARVHTPAAGDVIALGGLRFEVLWPPQRPPGWRAAGDPNEHALVARLEAGGLSVLLAADAESGVTAPLRLDPVDVLKVAHHGSADPGLPALLARIKPRIAAIEVGRGNRYGHPAPSTLAALKAAVPTVVRTDRDGTARLHAAGGRMWIE